MLTSQRHAVRSRYEMNALNQTWDLLLERAYDDGGGENSTRVDGKNGWDMQPPL